MVDPALLATLRPGMPATALSDLVGEGWIAPGNHDKGYVRLLDMAGFGARIDSGGHLGSVSFTKLFPPGLAIGGLHIGIPFDAAKLAYPGIEPFPQDSSDGIEAFRTVGPDGSEVRMRFKDGALLGFDLMQPDAAYPEPPPPKAYPRTAGAYDIDILPHGAAPGDPGHGWCHGLPPGITPVQWPLDPRTGHPLRHAFTLLLPPSHRVKGPDLVAISLFGTDHTGTVAPKNALVAETWDATQPPPDTRLLPVWQHRQDRHRHEYRMTDILDEPYAVIWLTQAEFDGGVCHPPLHPGNTGLDVVPLPDWTRIGAAAVFSRDRILTVEELATGVGGAWAAALAANRAFRWTLRAEDPNAGLAPPDGWDETTAAGYQCYWTSDTADGPSRILDWAQPHKLNHIGGTMRPYQSHPSPAFSPYYIEFEEELGGFNFGGGCAQLDLDQMRLDWACG